MSLDPRIPDGALADKWANQQANFKLVSPNNKAKYKVIVIGSGLAGASAAATLAEQGYQVDCFSFNDSPRRAHSVAAQGGINAAKNYRNDGDSTYRLFYDTIKGGDFRSREANVYRLAEVSGQIIDHCVAQGIPFARDYAGYLDSRSFGGVQVSRTFYARGQTGQQLLLGAYGALNRQIHLDKVRMFTRSEMLDVVVEDGVAQGIIVRNLVSGEVSRFNAHAVIIASGGWLIKDAFDKGDERQLHIESLAELGNSLEMEIAPRTIELEERTITLSGSVEDQYDQWRDILADIYANEVGEAA
ncbi:MAG: FAD-binding protein, partial [Gammaproteobacteria bacterium]|nr:FAD-binding protein [Gammaproteobacteria bacterium]